VGIKYSKRDLICEVIIYFARSCNMRNIGGENDKILTEHL